LHTIKVHINLSEFEHRFRYAVSKTNIASRKVSSYRQKPMCEAIRANGLRVVTIAVCKWKARHVLRGGLKVIDALFGEAVRLAERFFVSVLIDEVSPGRQRLAIGFEQGHFLDFVLNHAHRSPRRQAFSLF
jgi:hypothetical protein